MTRTTTCVSADPDGASANGESFHPALSADGRFVSFTSAATNLVAADTNGVQDIFVHDRVTRITTRVSVASNGTQANIFGSDHASLSADGRFVAFEAAATNLVPGDTNGQIDVFVHDRETGTTTRASVASDGTQGNRPSIAPAISADGRFVAFASGATNLASPCSSAGGIFVRDRLAATATCISVGSDGTPGNNGGAEPALSANGRFVAFTSNSTNLVDGCGGGLPLMKTDIFVHDRVTATTTCESRAADGRPGNSISGSPALSADGRFVAFGSESTNLASPCTQGFHIFVRDRLTGTTTCASVAPDGTQGNAGTVKVTLTANGDSRLVAFPSAATNLIRGDTNGSADIFVARLAVGPNWLLTGPAASVLSLTLLYNDGSCPGSCLHPWSRRSASAPHCTSGGTR